MLRSAANTLLPCSFYTLIYRLEYKDEAFRASGNLMADLSMCILWLNIYWQSQSDQEWMRHGWVCVAKKCPCQAMCYAGLAVFMKNRDPIKNLVLITILLSEFVYCCGFWKYAKVQNVRHSILLNWVKCPLELRT